MSYYVLYLYVIYTRNYHFFFALMDVNPIIFSLHKIILIWFKYYSSFELFTTFKLTNYKFKDFIVLNISINIF